MFFIVKQKAIDEISKINIDYQKRPEYALSLLTDWFDRKDYLKINKGISTSTASRDLKQLLEEGIIESTSKERLIRYRKKGG